MTPANYVIKQKGMTDAERNENAPEGLGRGPCGMCKGICNEIRSETEAGPHLDGAMRSCSAALLDALLAITRVSEKTCQMAASAQEPDHESLLELRRRSASDLHRASVAIFATCGCGVSFKMSALRLCLPGTAFGVGWC